MAVVSFSPFTFNVDTGELYLRHRRVHLSAQNARLLAILVEQAGKPVSRETLKAELWPGVEFIDYEHAINKGISQLRTALQDDSRVPRYIETIPRKGYRFCAEIGHAPAGLSCDEAPVQQQSGFRSLETPVHPIADSVVVDDVPKAKLMRFRQRIHITRMAGHSKMFLRLGLLGAIFISVVALVTYLALGSHVRAKGDLLTLGIPPLDASGPEADVLSERFRLDLSDSLAQLPGVKVRSIHSFSSSPRNSSLVAALANRQKLDVLLLGGFTTTGGKCSIQFELVRESDSAHLASLHYEGTVEQLRGIRDRIRQDVFKKLSIASSDDQPLKNSTTQPAYQAYLNGRRLLAERVDGSVNKAVEEFKRSIEIDSKFAPGYSGLASAYLLLADRDSLADGYNMARKLAMHALQLDESNAEAHALLGCIAFSQDWNSTVAEHELKRAIDLDPEEAVYHLWFASLLNSTGRFVESMKQIDLAKKADPYWPPVYQTETMVAGNAGDKERMSSAARTLVELTPAWPYAHDELAWAHWYAGRPFDAIKEWQQVAVLLNSPSRKSMEARGLEAFRKEGVRGYAEVRLQYGYSAGDSGYHTKTIQRAEWLAYAGKKREMFEALEDMVKRHDPALITLIIDPAFRPFRQDPRFRNIVSSTGIDIEF